MLAKLSSVFVGSETPEMKAAREQQEQFDREEMAEKLPHIFPKVNSIADEDVKVYQTKKKMNELNKQNNLAKSINATNLFRRTGGTSTWGTPSAMITHMVQCERESLSKMLGFEIFDSFALTRIPPPSMTGKWEKVMVYLWHRTEHCFSWPQLMSTLATDLDDIFITASGQHNVWSFEQVLVSPLLVFSFFFLSLLSSCLFSLSSVLLSLLW